MKKRRVRPEGVFRTRGRGLPNFVASFVVSFVELHNPVHVPKIAFKDEKDPRDPKDAFLLFFMLFMV